MQKIWLLGTVSVLGCGIMASAPAMAQDQARNDDAVVAEPGTDEIVVTAIRRSLASAQSIKRNSDAIVDSIVAEDIGKLPDITAAESAARITGLQVDRAQGEATGVRIRGLPDFSTTFNGRDIFIADGRSMNLQIFPSGSISRLDVYKSSTANLIEPGIAGLVDVRSRKPLDFKRDRVFGGISGVHWYQSQDLSAEGHLLISKRWDTSIGEIGVLVNGSYAQASYIDSTRNNALAIGSRQLAAYPDPIRYPNFVNTNYAVAKRTRPSANFAVQWRPNRDLELYVDGIWQGFRNRGEGRNLQVTVGGAAGIPNVEFYPDSDLVKSMDTRGGAFPTGGQLVVDADTNTYQIGGGFKWKQATLSLSGDLAYTDSTYTLTNSRLNFMLRGAPDKHFDFDTDDGEGGPTVTLSNFDLFDPANYRMVGLAETGSKSGRHGIQARIDGEYQLSSPLIDKLQFGLRFSDHDAFRYNYDQNHIAPPGTFYTALPLEYQTLTPGFRNDDAESLRVFLVPTRKSLIDNLDYLRELTTLSTPEFGEPTYQANEKDYAGYIQARYAFDVGFPVDGLVGVRAVRTEDRISGYARETLPDPDGGDDIVTETPISRSNGYTDFLPNVSARLRPARDFQIRLAFTKTRTRPGFGQLNPTLTIGLPPSICVVDPEFPDNGPDNPDCVRTASSGNADLDPIESTNYDVSFEYYPARSTALTVGLFHRDVSGFISNFTVEVDDPEYRRLRITRPDNGGKGKIQGIEASATTLLDASWLPKWLHDFGFQANYTYIDHSSELPEEYAQFLPGQQPIAGVSSHIYNIVGFYEIKGLSLRVAYNHRSKFVVNYQRINDPGIGGLGPVLPMMADGRGTLDLAATLHPTKNFAISFNASNILGAALKTHRQFNAEGDEYPFQTQFLESVYRVGLRFNF